MNPMANRAERGQVLVIVAMGMVAIVAMVGLVIDGGYAWTRQRDTQNGADAVAKAGTIVIQHYYHGDSPAPTDHDVACAAEAAAASNGVVIEAAEYTDHEGAPLNPAVAVGTCSVDLGVSLPPGAQGVKARASETFNTFLMPVIGIPHLTTIADAIAVVGAQDAIAGGALPVTFPETSSTCDRINPVDFTIRAEDGDGTWEPYEIINEADADATNLAIVPLCDIAPGSVGWLDWDCGQNLAQSIEDPCEVFIPIPAWVHTQTGNVNNLEDQLNQLAGTDPGTPEPEDSVVALPVHNFTCRHDIPDPDPTSACAGPPAFPEWSGNGDNLYYHVPYWIGFKLDGAFTGGDDPECGEPEGSPLIENPDPPGKVGCLKGWFVDRFSAPGPISIRPIGLGETAPLRVVLIN
ncbi:MAG: pilus assembly protein TadG-related protein [Candidatus Limnocylindria bacterium]